MLPSTLVRVYGSQVAVASAFDVTFQAVSKWCKQGYIPWPRQLDIHHRTAGRFKARMADIPPAHRPRSGPGSGLSRTLAPAGAGRAAAGGEG